LCFYLGIFPKISYYVYANILNSEILLAPKEYSTYTDGVGWMNIEKILEDESTLNLGSSYRKQGSGVTW
jgi:hypothetical protein